MGALVDIVQQSQSLEPESKSVYLRCVRRFEAFRPDPRTWTAMTVETWRDHLARTGLKSQTVNKHLYALRYASKRREALGQGPDFARASESIKVHRSKRREALGVEDIEAMLSTCASATGRDLRDRALIVLGVKTGLRVSELMQLSWSNIKGRQATVIAKGGHQHTTYLDDECLAALEAWKKWWKKRPERVFVGLVTKVEGGKAGKPLSRQALHRILAERGQKAKIQRPVHPHLLRHTFVTWSLAAGVPVQRVMIMTGHRSLQTLSGYVTDLEAENDPVGAYLPSLLKKRAL